MALSEFELHADRLSTNDARGRRIYVHPADVRGFFRRRRTYVQTVLIIFFLALPWFRIHGRQALLFDISQRRFEIFGLSLRAHNAPLLIFVFAAAAFALFFATALWGRIWCGWFCPQTVFIDGVYRRIERWIDGSSIERRKLDIAPWRLAKIQKRGLKWLLYLGATLIITHSFLAYFLGTDRLAAMMTSPPRENWESFLFMAVSSAIVLLDFAWFREQFCTIVCPYGRFQSVIMDSNSTVVAYDLTRGEPRATPQAKALAKNHNSQLGDCVNCYRCVQVCPTGIDIRRGLQMECIACTSCIDACDEVMIKIKKPTGLIRYSSLATSSTSSSPSKKRWNVRAGIYLTLAVAALGALLMGFASIQPVNIVILRAKDAPYTTRTDQDGNAMVINHFRLELSNQSGVPHQLGFRTTTQNSSDVTLITAQQPFVIQDGLVTQVDLFIQFSKSSLQNGQKQIFILISDSAMAEPGSADVDHSRLIEKEVTLVGPY